MTRPRVLMVTGAYHPETSGAALQCRQLIARLHNDVAFTVLTTSFDARLPAQSTVDGIPVVRVYVEPTSVLSKARATDRMSKEVLGLRDRFDVVHLHGFSQKTLLLIGLAHTLGKRVIIKLTSVGHDDALSMKARGWLSFRAYRSADRFVGVSPRFEAAHRSAGLEMSRFRLIPNGVDLSRFSPPTASERREIRRHLGLPLDDPVVLFVGFFSHEKRPDLLYRAWSSLMAGDVRSTLVFVGDSQSAYYEIDRSMAANIRADAERKRLLPNLVFMERTREIEQYYRASDVFALPTLREGLPNVLLEAMACGVAPIISRLEGVTDWIVDDGVTGILVPPQDKAAWTDALGRMLRYPDFREAVGRAARESVAARFGIERTAELTLALYRELVG